MNGAAAHKPIARPSAAEVFRLRCISRARLWASGEIDLDVAVDELQESAVASGLVELVGQDEVQAIMSSSFGAVRGDLAVTNVTGGTAESADNEDAAVTNVTADDHEGLSPSFAALCRAADERQRARPVDPNLARLRELMADDVSLERAYAELSKPAGVAARTLMAAEFLAAQGDVARLRAWLARHTPQERKAIKQHLEAKQCR